MDRHNVWTHMPTCPAETLHSALSNFQNCFPPPHLLSLLHVRLSFHLPISLLIFSSLICPPPLSTQCVREILACVSLSLSFFFLAAKTCLCVSMNSGNAVSQENEGQKKRITHGLNGGNSWNGNIIIYNYPSAFEGVDGHELPSPDHRLFKNKGVTWICHLRCSTTNDQQVLALFHASFNGLDLFNNLII